MKRDNIETFRQPFLVDQALEELRVLIWCTASQVALLGRGDLADAMIEPDADFGMSETPAAYLSKIDLSAFEITNTVTAAYDFAFQINDPTRFGADRWGDLGAFVSGGVRHSWSGDMSPTLREDSKLRHLADMVQGRVNLLMGDALSIRQLALLANMIEPAVRSSLSAEGIKTEGRPASLPADTALSWLSGRRGFVPTADGLAARDLATDFSILGVSPFPSALEQLLSARRVSKEEIAVAAEIESSLITKLIAGTERNAGVLDLMRLAEALGIVPHSLLDAYFKFVSK